MNDCQFPDCSYPEHSYIHRDPTQCVVISHDGTPCTFTESRGYDPMRDGHDVPHHGYLAAVVPDKLESRTPTLQDIVNQKAEAMIREADERNASRPKTRKPVRPENILAPPGKLILYFAPPEDTLGAGVLFSADGWTLRREIGTLVSIGPAIDKYERKLRHHILRMAGESPWQQFRAKHLGWLNRLTEWKRPRGKFIVSIMLGTQLIRTDIEAFYTPEYRKMLNDLRVYDIGHMAASIEEVYEEE